MKSNKIISLILIIISLGFSYSIQNESKSFENYLEDRNITLMVSFSTSSNLDSDFTLESFIENQKFEMEKKYNLYLGQIGYNLYMTKTNWFVYKMMQNDMNFNIVVVVEDRNRG